MSLDDLIARYTPDRPLAERRALLEAMATRLPAPEFLWYDLAMQALHGDEDELKVSAITLLAQSSRSWHQILMTALTDGSVHVQAAALKALYLHATMDPERRDAFDALGELPGWRVESVALWQALALGLNTAKSAVEADPDELQTAGWPDLPAALRGVTDLAPCDLGRLEEALGCAREEIEALEARLMDLEEENFMLRDDRTRIAASFETEFCRAEGLKANFEALQDRHEALHIEMLDQIERLKLDGDVRDHHHLFTVTGLQSALELTRVRSRRTLTAGLLSLAVLAAVGGPVAYSFVSHASVMAMSPEDLPAGKRPALRHHVVAASRPAVTPHVVPTPMALAPNPSSKLLVRLAPNEAAQKTQFIADVSKPNKRLPTVTKAMAKAPVASLRLRTIHTPQANSTAKKPALVLPTAPSTHSLSIPAAIRAKF